MKDNNDTCSQTLPNLDVPLIIIPEEGRFCNDCKRAITPNRIYEPTTLTWFVCGGVCMIGCWFGVCLAPLCINSFQVATVYCSACNSIINKAEYT